MFKELKQFAQEMNRGAIDTLVLQGTRRGELPEGVRFSIEPFDLEESSWNLADFEEGIDELFFLMDKMDFCFSGKKEQIQKECWGL